MPNGQKLFLLVQKWEILLKSIPELTDKENLFSLWKAWSSIVNQIHEESTFEDELFEFQPATESVLNFYQKTLDDFQKSFTAKYSPVEETATPYIHILLCHSKLFFKEYGTLSKFKLFFKNNTFRFSQQGLEGSHKLHKSLYFRSTSHDGGKFQKSAILQLFQKIYRTCVLGLLLNENLTCSFERSIFDFDVDDLSE